jgi:hypothetical protein
MGFLEYIWNDSVVCCSGFIVGVFGVLDYEEDKESYIHYGI